MDTLILVVIAFLVVSINLLGLWFMGRRMRPERGEGLTILQQEVQALARTLETRLRESSAEVHESVRYQFSESQRSIKDITEAVTKLNETNKQVVSFADQLQSLENILKNPKQRGILGEYFLETVLKNTLPPDNYQMQYTFSNGDIVDAVVFVKEKIVPVDSKFSLENYNRIVEEKNDAERVRLLKVFENDLKLRVKETAKYIRPKENTLEFAFMFIPHEAIYYDLLVNKIGADENILERAAREYKVLIVSPTSFLAYLQTVLQGLRALQIEEQAQTILRRVGDLGRHLGAYDTYMQKLGGSLATTVNAYNTAHKELGKIDKDVLRITGEAAHVEVLTLEKPVKEEG